MKSGIPGGLNGVGGEFLKEGRKVMVNLCLTNGKDFPHCELSHRNDLRRERNYSLLLLPMGDLWYGRPERFGIWTVLQRRLVEAVKRIYEKQ